MDFAFYWSHTDAVSKTLFFVLLVLSLASWVIGIMRVLNSRRSADTISQDLTSVMADNDLSGLDFNQKKMITEQKLLQHIARHRYQLEQGLPVLGTTASIAPFIGLFGTVWGIFHALASIGASGQAGLAQVAGPVGEALIMTGLGLAVAIPAVIFYNVAMRLNKKALHIANDTAHQILAKTAQ
ncbi:MotA/TolQ/ExbB proton channel family protein [Moraxella sp. FZFQ2102]|uniref:MotA/TolQ/ExbB proton channel family protein n=1 Tax=Moraxella sp. FZFQ2102 TaxID=2953752 RepID=UPI00209BE76D|nr:MotA/TolQ/ExbB proton channel family protein [Moraxella sp. FZFQ2102]USZ14909.1 MotA/TolQ/ExbB proton channel family protein [Moraxella sp. FZFQ2102]